jgi:hypothetical protein
VNPTGIEFLKFQLIKRSGLQSYYLKVHRCKEKHYKYST